MTNIDENAAKPAQALDSTEKKLAPYWRVLVGNLLLAGLFVVSVCSLSTAGAVLPVLVVILALLPMAIYSSISVMKRPSDLWCRQLRLHRWTRVAIYCLAIAIGLIFNSQARQEDERKFDAIVSAVNHYLTTEHRYPESLGQLVPQYLGEVPRPRFGRFLLSSSSADTAVLTYMPEPFTHLAYDFKSKTRRIWD